MTKLKGLNRGLGRGLDSLLAGDMGSVGEADSLLMLKVAQLRPGKYQPRSYMDDAALQTLAASIKSQGIMQPILVRHISIEQSDAEQYEIIAGERRWRASQIAGLEEVPVLVREIADEAALAMALIENIQRENLNPLEEAQGIKRLIDEFAMTHEKAAAAVGRSRVAVSNLLRLLTLCAPVQEILMVGKLDMGHARALVGLSGAQQIMLAEQIVQNNLSVRDVESAVKKLNVETEKPPQKHTQNISSNPDVLRLQESLSDQLGAVVSIKAGANGSGSLKINYANLDQLDEIVAKISR
ncbi:ParB/RepB/Spo0J family partition protein [Methylotenera sp.]|uniref:ParB/RepB/Spo0J family partition protein n=2 Tax=Methylotenera sp. TaxID=2051956 RepID=UPI002721A59F|nr:ParB/RepB/Spo0J family partition protein [Methylotenera sp.]MDO9392572.1 ParB/RepB/Spo0J family partition protein [Methylotenera sp.]MDP1522460.1 ParB/RepB/Spo0J family partition protein [Methylotenera sp.]MDP2072450.1 ParB/RepB/Spo0J family partition protein [Methylotenera sp.]MDP2229481.1 ParB/RepB/Spo0J family partition protein [Methylotenera sp.]MDP3006244.1 ParB/RepB/Spo0J family partition protein [Methylotenera sp.]